ncbi:MAG: 4-hydroxy-3-methylbut-2-enyl diphosphate reductase [Planctomycetota bacterium]|nr:4-hydroxy-3-methylbut-2-enyl diphosphate reductase [Planctomycetota bacterium]
MKVIRAEAMGLCFGVRDALTLASNTREPESVTIHGELVHNETVLDDLRARGFTLTDEARRGGLPETPTVMITAHGVSERERGRLAAAGKHLIDTTCPLVVRVHDAARQLEADGYNVVVIGKPGHVEVRGIVEDLAWSRVVSSPDAVECYGVARVGVVCQTTAAARDVAAIRAAIEARNPDAEIRFVDTVCQPTRDRQAAIEKLIGEVEAMVVVGGANSNNTKRLAARCRERSLPVHHVQGADDLDADWCARFAVVGLTAGTSTPDATIDAVERALVSMPRVRGALHVDDRVR